MTTAQKTDELYKLQKTITRLEKLLTISRALNSDLNLDSLLFSIVHAATQLTETEASSILLLDKRTDALYFEATTSQKKDVLAHVWVPIDQSVAGWIVTHGEPVVLNDATQDPRHYRQPDKKTDFVTKALLGVPLKVKEETIGALEVLNPKEGILFTEEDVHTLTVLAAQAAVAIQNARLFKQSDQIADIIHELRTPMTAIIGFSKLLLERKDLTPEMQRSFLETINQEAEHLAQMVNDFLDLAHLETRRTHLEMASTDLNKVVLDAISLLEQQAQANNLTLNYHLPATPLPAVLDAAHIKQMLVNLISNAIKYNKPGGGVSIRVQQDDEYVIIIIADTGLGMPAEAVNNIFDKFYRVVEHQTEIRGTGLGLAIVKEIVEAHGGSIKVKSKLNHGSTFTVKLPLKQM
ncbi:MAG: GAF domain-containing sensor histidine kinase [Phycisphaerae bacterium]|nr:GAF domain-containing sensor histidine kinase [Phycisphaerae bacterium]NIX29180.1 GAF domain-containing protein [Phycisphaerae bacterium]